MNKSKTVLHDLAVIAAITMIVSTPLSAARAGDAQDQARTLLLAHNLATTSGPTERRMVTRDPQQQAAAALLAQTAFPRLLVSRSTAVAVKSAIDAQEAARITLSR